MEMYTVKTLFSFLPDLGRTERVFEYENLQLIKPDWILKFVCHFLNIKA